MSNLDFVVIVLIQHVAAIPNKQFLVLKNTYLHCVGAVGLAAGRASGL